MASEGEDSPMSSPNLGDHTQEIQLRTSEADRRSLPAVDLRPANVEMARVLKTAPLRMASDLPNGAIAHWKHGALHDVVRPMTDHVVMTYPTGIQRLERRTGKSVAIGTARPGVGDDHSGRFKRPMGHSRRC